MLDPISIPKNPVFKGLFDVVFIDEKWFYLTKKTHNCYGLPDEEEHLRVCKSKNFIPKLMFLCAVTRPRFNDKGQKGFVLLGKLGVFLLSLMNLPKCKGCLVHL